MLCHQSSIGSLKTLLMRTHRDHSWLPCLLNSEAIASYKNDYSRFLVLEKTAVYY